MASPHDLSSLRMGTSWTCDRSAPGTLNRKRWWTVSWRCGKNGPAAATKRKELLPVPFAGTGDFGEQTSSASSIKAALLVLMQSGWWTQEVAQQGGESMSTRFCLKCGPAAASIVGMSSLPRNPHGPSSESSASGTDCDWRQTQVGGRPDARPCMRSALPGRTHDGTIHVWIHPSVVGNSFGGNLFVDGSLMCKHGSQGGQAGWAVFPRAGLHSARCHANLSPSAYLAGELWALWQAIILSEPGATFVSDCATVLRGSERGPKWCTAAWRPHADVWRRHPGLFPRHCIRSPHRRRDEM